MKYFIDLFTKLFSNKEKEYDLSEYKTHDEIGEAQELSDIIAPEVPKNDKINLIIMDDNEAAGEITKQELIALNKLADSVRTSGLEELNEFNNSFIRRLTNMQLVKLTKFDINNYNIIMCTGKMAAFQVMKLLENNTRIDKAFLDILIGGYNIHNNKTTILDGIDVAKEIYTYNESSEVLFYSGCSLSEDSDEYIKSKKELNKDIRKMVLSKDNDQFGKKIRLIEFMVD